MTGALAYYVSNKQVVDYQPMCASFSLILGDDGPNKQSTAIQSIRNYSGVLAELRYYGARQE